MGKRERETERQRDRQRDRQTDRQTDRHTDRDRERENLTVCTYYCLANYSKGSINETSERRG